MKSTATFTTVYFATPQAVEHNVIVAKEYYGVEKLNEDTPVDIVVKRESLVNFNNGVARHTYTDAFDTDLDSLIDYIKDFHGIVEADVEFEDN